MSDRGTSVDFGRGWFRQDQGFDSPDSLSDRRKRRKSVEYYGDHLYEQGSTGDERTGGPDRRFWFGERLGDDFSFHLCTYFEAIH